jgi:hypothetical protein
LRQGGPLRKATPAKPLTFDEVSRTPMTPGLTADLAFAGGVILFAAWLMLRRPLGGRAAFLLALARVGLVVVYFGFFDDGSWRLPDDINYTEQSLDLASSHGGAVGVLTSSEGFTMLGAVAGGTHFGYYAYNLIAFELFGEHYWAPVFLNVLMSFVAALALLSMARSAGLGEAVRVPLAAVFLLHPDVIVWSSFLNLKDTLAMALTAWLLALTLRLQRNFKLTDVLIALLICATLSVVRSYLIVLYGIALTGWALLHAGWGMRVLAVGLGFAALPFAPKSGLNNFHPESAPSGLLEFIMTPRPWAVTRSYEFLVIPAAVHWTLLPLTIWGVIWLWRQGGHRARLLVIYAAVLVAFYSCVPLLAGPRHRFQLVYVLVAAQAAGAYALAREVLAQRLGSVPGTARVTSLPATLGDESVAP